MLGTWGYTCYQLCIGSFVSFLEDEETAKTNKFQKNILGLMWENTTHERISSQWGADEYWRLYTSIGTRTPGSSSHFHFLVRNAISSILSLECAALTNSQK